jgi:hypothetical protein
VDAALEVAIAATPTAVFSALTRFMMDPANLNDAWRDANIIPRYNAAGVRRFAFLFPDGMPAIGAPPAAEGPATFPTAYFARRQEALDWLAG